MTNQIRHASTDELESIFQRELATDRWAATETAYAWPYAIATWVTGPRRGSGFSSACVCWRVSPPVRRRSRSPPAARR